MVPFWWSHRTDVDNRHRVCWRWTWISHFSKFYLMKMKNNLTLIKVTKPKYCIFLRSTLLIHRLVIGRFMKFYKHHRLQMCWKVLRSTIEVIQNWLWYNFCNINNRKPIINKKHQNKSEKKRYWYVDRSTHRYSVTWNMTSINRPSEYII